MAQGTKEDPFIGPYRIDAVRDAGQLQLGPNTFNKFLLDLTNAAGQQKQDLEMLRKPQSPAPQAGPSPVQMQVFQDKGYWKCKYAPANQGGPPAQGGGGGQAAGVTGSDEERNRSIIMQVSVKVAAEVLKGTNQAHVDGLLTYGEALAEGILAFSKKGQAAPTPAPQPQAQQAPPPQAPPQAAPAPQGTGWGNEQTSFPATNNDDIPF